MTVARWIFDFSITRCTAITLANRALRASGAGTPAVSAGGDGVVHPLQR